MNAPNYEVEFSREDQIKIHKALRWHRHKINPVHQPDEFRAVTARNLELIGDVSFQGGKVQFGVRDLNASDIGYIRMCLAQYAQDQRRNVNRKSGELGLARFEAEYNDLLARLNTAVDPRQERAYALSKREAT